MSFALDPRLAADTVPVAALGLCELRLMNDRRYPWLVLVPRRPGAVELHALPAADRKLLMDEIALAAAALAEVAPEAKINVATLGNVVRQLHVHVVARTSGDAAWPGPVWGHGRAVPYDEAAREALLAALRPHLPAAAQGG